MQTLYSSYHYYDLAVAGKKKVFPIVNTKNFTTGEDVRIVNVDTNEEFTTKIKEINFYPSVEKLIIKEGLKNVCPDLESLEEGIEKYRRFEGKIKEFGVIAIQI